MPTAQLISYVKNQVEQGQSGGHDWFTVHDIRSLKGVSSGRGLVYSWIQGVDETATSNCQFELSQPTPAEYPTIGQGQIIVEFDPKDKFPRTGIVTSNGEGYLIAPALRLDVGKGREIVLMLLSPPARPHNVSVEKNVLTIPDGEATVTVTTGNGEVRCQGTFPTQSKEAKIILNRNPRLPVYRAGFNETVSRLRGHAQMNVVWKPVARSFEELVLVFDPSSICSLQANSLSFDKIQAHLTGPDPKGAGDKGDYVTGDGIGVSYTIRLLLHRGLGRHSSDKTRLYVT